MELLAICYIVGISTDTSKGEVMVSLTPVKKACFMYKDAYTDAETTFIADNFDLAVLNEPLDPAGLLTVAQTLKVKNAAIKILIYREAHMIYDGYDDWATVDANEAWFLHTAGADRIQNTGSSWWLLDAENSGWQAHLTSVLNAKLTSSAYDGVFLDDVHDEYPVWWTLSGAVQAADLATWHADVLDELTYLKANLTTGKTLIINSDQMSEYDYVTFSDGVCIEGFVHPPWIATGANNADWFQLAQVVDLGYIAGTLNKTVIALSGTSTTPVTDDVVKYCYAGFLTTTSKNAESYFAFNMAYNYTGDDAEHGYYSIMDTDLGSKALDASLIDGVYQRFFDGGLVLFNPSATTYTVPIAGAYKTLAGVATSSVTLAAYSAEVLLTDVYYTATYTDAHMRQVIRQSEQFPSIGITSPTVDTPGTDNFNSHMRGVLADMAKKE